jgi:hypothetical protein
VSDPNSQELPNATERGVDSRRLALDDLVIPSSFTLLQAQELIALGGWPDVRLSSEDKRLPVPHSVGSVGPVRRKAKSSVGVFASSKPDRVCSQVEVGDEIGTSSRAS